MRYFSRRKLRRPGAVGLSVAVLLGVMAWSYHEALALLVGRWWNDPDYLYGFLVPVVAGYVLWTRRAMLDPTTPAGSWWALIPLAAAALMQWASAYFYHQLLDPASLLPCLAGVALLIGGWAWLRWAWPALAFLAFMIPLPGAVATLLSHPLQRIATTASTYLVQTIGIPSVSHGNIIVLSDTELGVAEACNGLQMIMLFAAVCVGAAMLVRRSTLEKVIIVASAVPITLLANVLRIVVTVILYELFPKSVGHAFFHDLAGWFMMPSAVLLLWGELWVLDRALVERAAPAPLTDALAGLRRGPRPVSSTRAARSKAT